MSVHQVEEVRSKKIPVAFRVDSETNRMFYNSKELQDYDPVFYYGCKTRPRNILIKKNIPVTDYLYANFNGRNGAWIPSTDGCKKAQLLISKTWVDAHMRSMREFVKEIHDIPASINDDDPPPVDSNIPPVPVVSGGGGGSEEYENAPPLLILEEYEKFHDIDGNILDIETRGTKDRKGIRFRVKDVMEAFNMPSLDHTLRRTDDGGKYTSEHYQVYFIRDKGGLPPSPTIKKAQYLTYKGIMRVLFASNSGNADKFQDWAEDTLFTHQMGTKEAKEGLAANLAGIDIKTFKAVFDTYATTFPCIYLMYLGTVKELRATFGIDSHVVDDLVVYKYGFTRDLGRRFQEHAGTYGKMSGVNLRLMSFHAVDTKYTANAESDVRGLMHFKHANLTVDGRKELVALSGDDLTYVKQEYSRIGARYAGATAGLTAEINELKSKIKDLENELQKERYEKKMVEMKLDSTSQMFELKEANYKMEIQLMKHGINK